MEEEGSILDALLDEDADDFEMMDLEEGELVGLEGDLVDLDLHNDSVKNTDGDGDLVNEVANNQNSKRRKKKKRKNSKKKKESQGTSEINIDRFVLNACKRLKERKTHMLYTAVGCLGVSALSDLIKEVDAIQACGGQKIANGNRFRTGGGILWNVLKTRDPNAYKEIMKKTREFEKQFRQQSKGQGLAQNKEVSSERVQPEPATEGVSDCRPRLDYPLNQSNIDEKRTSIRDRIRVPVTYDDIIQDEGRETQSTVPRQT